MDTRALTIPGHHGEHVNVNAGERMLSVFAGGLLAAAGLRQSRGLGAVLAGTGGVLMWRGVTGRCPLYEASGINSAEKEYKSQHLVQSVTVNAPPERLYELWRNFENLPQFLESLQSVRVMDSRRSLWQANGPVRQTVEWEAEITNDVPNQLIEWRSTGDASIPNSGSVQFRRATGDRGTIVRVEIHFQPPAGSIGLGVAKVLGRAPDQEIQRALRRFKQLVETGEIVTTRGQSTGSGLRQEPESRPDYLPVG